MTELENDARHFLPLRRLGGGFWDGTLALNTVEACGGSLGERLYAMCTENGHLLHLGSHPELIALCPSIVPSYPQSLQSESLEHDNLRPKEAWKKGGPLG